MVTFSPARPAVLLAPLTLLLAGITGVATGVATLYLQAVLPPAYYLLADSGAVWTLIAVAAALATGGRRPVGVASGTLALVGLVAGYYGWGHASGLAVAARYEVALWLAAALVIGPAAGLAGHAIRRGPAGHRLVAYAAVGGVLTGEATYLLREDIGGSLAGPELGAGLALALGAALLIRAPVAARLGALVVGGLVAAAICTAYLSG